MGKRWRAVPPSGHPLLKSLTKGGTPPWNLKAIDQNFAVRDSNEVFYGAKWSYGLGRSFLQQFRECNTVSWCEIHDTMKGYQSKISDLLWKSSITNVTTSTEPFKEVLHRAADKPSDLLRYGEFHLLVHVISSFWISNNDFSSTTLWIFDSNSTKWPRWSSVSFLLLKSKIDWLAVRGGEMILLTGGGVEIAPPHHSCTSVQVCGGPL